MQADLSKHRGELELFEILIQKYNNYYQKVYKFNALATVERLK